MSPLAIIRRIKYDVYALRLLWSVRPWKYPEQWNAVWREAFEEFSS